MTTGQEPKDLSPLASPPSRKGVPAWLTYLFTIIGIIYLLNPTAGILELIPDNLPFIGNLDEGLAALLVWYGLLEFFEGKKFRKGGK
ncbi:MAG: hypothetical protein ACE5H9_16235 [Anaerolineae bacterium]